MLSALCIRSKAHWGYDADFMRQCEDALAITPAMIGAGHVLVAERNAGDIVGVAAIGRVRGDRFELERIFVEPAAIRGGVGRPLFAAAVERARQEGGKRLTILSDPFAEAFYERMGARRTGTAPSDAIPGRRLATFEYVLAGKR